MAEHLQASKIRVAGHLEEVRGISHIKLNWTDENGKRKRKSVTTGLAVKRNKKRAEDMLREVKQELEDTLVNNPKTPIRDMLFADFMVEWLEVVKPRLKLTTYGGYQLNVNSAIAPYFREKGIML